MAYPETLRFHLCPVFLHILAVSCFCSLFPLLSLHRAGGHALEVEIGRTPEIVLLEQVAVGGVGHHDGAERADEGAEDDAEGDQVLRRDLQGHEEADDGADQRADEGADGERAPARHRGGRGAQTGGAAQPEGIDVPELVPPQILHLDALI